jgi:hypothetical protein
MRHFFAPIVALAIATMFCGCTNKALMGPCYEAAQYRKQAESANAEERAALEGKAIGAEAACQKQGDEIHHHQADDVKYRR